MTTKTDGDRLLRAAVNLLAEMTQSRVMIGGRATELHALVEEIAPGRVDRARRTLLRKKIEHLEARRWTGPVPAWAKNLMNKHASGYRLHWKPENRDGSSGRCAYYSHIVVNAGADVVDQRAVLIHEIAHARTEGHAHDATFWDELYRLAVIEGAVEVSKARHPRSFAAAQRRARQNRSTQ